MACLGFAQRECKTIARPKRRDRLQAIPEASNSNRLVADIDGRLQVNTTLDEAGAAASALLPFWTT